MTFTYVLTNNIGLVRLKIMDRSETTMIFSDEEISAFLLFETSSNNTVTVLRASAAALEAIAGNQVLVLKVIKLLQMSTDGAKVAAELRAQAKTLRDQADKVLEDSGEGIFDVVEMINDDFAYREKIFKLGIQESL